MLAPALCQAQGYAITTVTGEGSLPPSASDGGPATNAALRGARIAVDGSGDLYIADGNENVIREVMPNGVITTVAGDEINQQPGYSGDGGPATSALLSAPSGVGVDTAGNFYIADTGNSRVRVVSSNGIITTFAGGGGLGSFPNLLGDGGPATAALLGKPIDVAADSNGNVFIADASLNVVRRVGPNGVITTAAGNGNSFSLAGAGDGGPATSTAVVPLALAVDSSGNLYIADNATNRIRMVSPSGVITTVAGSGSRSYSGDGGPATSAGLNGSSGVAVDASGNIYVSDSGNDRMRLVTPDGTINTIGGSGSSSFSGDGGPALNAGIVPGRIALGPGGVVYFEDMSVDQNGANNRVRLLSPSGQ